MIASKIVAVDDDVREPATGSAGGTPNDNRDSSVDIRNAQSGALNWAMTIRIRLDVPPVELG